MKSSVRAAIAVAGAVACAAGGCGCSPRIELGGSVVWSARHESGNLAEWLEGGEGGAEADAPDATVTVTAERAHTGRYSVRLGNVTVGDYKAARLWRQQEFPTEAYYSAWFFLPSGYKTVSDWTILQLSAPNAADPAGVPLLLDVDVRSLPGSELILTIYDHRPAYLRAPTPVPPLFVPVGRWFQIEIFFRNADDDSGRFTLRLDGQLDYDLARPMGPTAALTFTPCSISADLSPAASEIYVDDVAVSLVPVTPNGSL